MSNVTVTLVGIIDIDDFVTGDNAYSKNIQDFRCVYCRELSQPCIELHEAQFFETDPKVIYCCPLCVKIRHGTKIKLTPQHKNIIRKIQNNSKFTKLKQWRNKNRDYVKIVPFLNNFFEMLDNGTKFTPNHLFITNKLIGFINTAKSTKKEYHNAKQWLKNLTWFYNNLHTNTFSNNDKLKKMYREHIYAYQELPSKRFLLDTERVIEEATKH